MIAAHRGTRTSSRTRVFRNGSPGSFPAASPQGSEAGVRRPMCGLLAGRAGAEGGVSSSTFLLSAGPAGADGQNRRPVSL